MPITLDEQEQPYFFILNGNLSMRNVFIPTKEDSNYTADYLDCLGHKYWHSSHENHKH
ncbi:hypothetical protein [Viscerimonas tarda]